jgi:hypothetical protein
MELSRPLAAPSPCPNFCFATSRVRARRPRPLQHRSAARTERGGREAVMVVVGAYAKFVRSVAADPVFQNLSNKLGLSALA